MGYIKKVYCPNCRTMQKPYTMAETSNKSGELLIMLGCRKCKKEATTIIVDR